jgi:hypothetical protein
VFLYAAVFFVSDYKGGFIILAGFCGRVSAVEKTRKT